MVNFQNARFEFVPHVLPSEEIDSPYAVSRHHETMSKSSDRTYPRRDELFQDEFGNLYLYKVINGTHKYVKISADATTGSTNGDVVNADVHMPYERLDKLTGFTRVNSAVFDDGLIAVAANNILSFYKYNEYTKLLEHAYNSDISVSEYAEYFDKKFDVFTYTNNSDSNNITFRVIVCGKVTNTSPSDTTIKAFKLVNVLNRTDTTFRIEEYGEEFKALSSIIANPSNGTTILKDNNSNNSFRAFVINSRVRATLSDNDIVFEKLLLDDETQDSTSWQNIDEVISTGNSNAVMIRYTMSPRVDVFTKDNPNSYTTKYLPIRYPVNGMALLNVKRNDTRPGAISPYAIACVSTFTNELNGVVFTSDFEPTSAEPMAANSFDCPLDEGEEFIRIIDNSQILNNRNIQRGYEKIVMSFVVFTKKGNFHNAYLYFCVPNQAEARNNGTNANEPYENSTYSVIRVGTYQFTGSEDIANLEKYSYIHLLDNGGLLENRSNAVVLYASSQFKYLSAAFADSLFAANLQAINASIKSIDSNIIKNHELKSDNSKIDDLNVNRSKTVEANIDRISLESKDTRTLEDLPEFEVSDDPRLNASYKNFFVKFDLDNSNVIIYDIDNLTKTILDVSFVDSAVSCNSITSTVNNGNFAFSINKYGYIFGTVLNNESTLKLYKFYASKSVNQLIDDSATEIEIYTSEDTVDLPSSNTISDLLSGLKITTTTDNSVIQIYQPSNKFQGQLLYCMREVTCDFIVDTYMDAKNPDNIYDINSTIIDREFEVRAYWTGAKVFDNLFGFYTTCDIPTSKLSAGLVYDRYIFIPVILNNGEFVIVRDFRPSIYYDEVSYGLRNTTSGIEYDDINKRVKFEMYDYPTLSCLNYVSGDALPFVATSSKTVRYVNTNFEVVDVNFHYSMPQNADSIAFSCSSLVQQTGNYYSYLGSKSYICYNNSLYFYTSYRGEFKILEVLPEGDINSHSLFRFNDYSTMGNNTKLFFVKDKIIFDLTKHEAGSPYTFVKKDNLFRNASFGSINASSTNVGHLSSGSASIVNAAVRQLDINNAKIRVKEEATITNGLSYGEKKEIINSADSYVAANSASSVMRLKPANTSDRFTFNTLNNKASSDHIAWPVIALTDSVASLEMSGRYMHFAVNMHQSAPNDISSIDLAISFVRQPYDSTLVSVDLTDTKHPGYLKPGVILLKHITPSNIAQNISDKSDFNRWTDFTYANRNISGESGVSCYMFNGSFSGNNKAYCTFDSNELYTYAEFKDCYDKSYKVRLKLCFFADVGNVSGGYHYIVLNNVEIKALDSDEFTPLLWLYENPIVLRLNSANLTWESYCYSTPQIVSFKYTQNTDGYNLKTNPNFIRVKEYGGTKFAIVPALIRDRDNPSTAINTGVLVGRKHHNLYDWKFINLQEISSNNNSLDTYYDTFTSAGKVLADIDINAVPFITDMNETSGNNKIDVVMALSTIVPPDHTFFTDTSLLKTGEPDSEDYVEDFNKNGYGCYTFKLTSNTNRSFLQYNRIMSVGFSINLDAAGGAYSFNVSKGAVNNSPEVVLIDPQVENYHLYASAKLLPNQKGIITRNGMSPYKNVDDYYITEPITGESYRNIIQDVYNGSYYSELSYNSSTGVIEDNVFTGYSIYASDNKFRDTSPHVNLTSENYALTLNTGIKKYFGSSTNNIWDLISRQAKMFDNDTLDLTADFGKVKDSDGANTYFNKASGKTVVSSVHVESILPKEIDMLDLGNGFTLFTYSFLASGRYQSSGSTVQIAYFASGCIFDNVNRYVSIGVTDKSAAGSWFDDEYSNRGSTRVYTNSISLRTVFSKYRFSTTRYTTTSSNNYGIGNYIDCRTKDFKPVHYIIDSDKDFYVAQAANQVTDEVFLLAIFSLIKSYNRNDLRNMGIDGTMLHVSDYDYSDFSHLNMVKAVGNYILLATDRYIISIPKDNVNDKMFTEIADSDYLGNNNIFTYTTNLGKFTAPVTYFGDDVGARNSGLMVCSYDPYHQDDIMTYFGKNLYFEGRKILTT